MRLLPDPGPGGKLNTDLEGRDAAAMESFFHVRSEKGQPGEWCRLRDVNGQVLQIGSVILYPLVQVAPRDERLHSQRVVEVINRRPLA